MSQSTKVSWLGALLEGEGYFAAPRDKRGAVNLTIALKMCDRDTVAKAAEILEAPVRGPRKYTERRRPYWEVSVHGPAAFHWMRRLYNYLGERRQLRVRLALRDYAEWKVGKTKCPQHMC